MNNYGEDKKNQHFLKLSLLSLFTTLLFCQRQHIFFEFSFSKSLAIITLTLIIFTYYPYCPYYLLVFLFKFIFGFATYLEFRGI